MEIVSERIVSLALPGLLLLLQVQGPAQADSASRGTSSAARGSVSGRVNRLDGKVWAHADLIFFSRPISDVVGVGKPDLVRAKSNDKGRFRAQLLHGHSYSAWAQGKEADGTPILSAILEEAMPGMVLKFVEHPG